ncbi:MAG: D-aminoacyl-tRNA deacylase [Pseudomonadota bacterium]
MKAVVQRVKNAHVIVDDKMVSKIGCGLLVFLGVGNEDTQKDADYLVEKIINLRIFEDENGKMNISLKDIKGQLLVVSQFTLMGDCKKGRRPSFINAAKPEKANLLYEYFITRATESGIPTQSGVFQAMMDVGLINQGPVTILIDTKDK